MTKNALRILPLGGIGEIGMNCLVLEYEKQIVLVDCGVQFSTANLPGVEFLCPDFSYVWERQDQVKGLVVTHGHDDHIGGVPYLCKKMSLDIHVTPFPEGLITHKLKEHDLLGRVTYHRIEPGKAFKVGPFEFDPVTVQHSIIEALGFAIRTPVGTLVHSGDFKHDPKPFKDASTDLAEFKKFGDEGVQLLLCDSTNADKPGHTISEYDVLDNLKAELQGQTGRVFIAMFSSNIRRIEGILKIVKEQNKKLVLLGRGLHQYTSLAFSQGSIQLPEDVLVLPEQTSKYSERDLVFLVTGAQAEPQSALVRIVNGTNPEATFKRGDTAIFSSRFIPGNERNISFLINEMCRQGVRCIYEGHRGMHVSGHGYQEDLRELHRACRAKFFVPVHGEYRHLCKHAEFAQTLGMSEKNIRIIENGDVLELTKDSLEKVETLDLDQIPIVLGTMMQSDADVFSQRSGMAKAGVVTCLVNRNTKRRLLADPNVVANGILYQTGTDVGAAEREAVQIAREIAETKSLPAEELAEEIRLALRRYFKSVGCYKPIVITRVLDH